MYYHEFDSLCDQTTDICDMPDFTNSPTNTLEPSLDFSKVVEESVTDIKTIHENSYERNKSAETCVIEKVPFASRNYPEFSSKASDFGEEECGEPLVAQHLTLDFSITEEDTDFDQKKCYSFWKFVYSMPHLKDLMVVPEPDKETDSQSESVSILASGACSTPPSPDITPVATAVDIVQRFKTKLDESFMTRQPTICLDMDHRDYCHGCSKASQENFGKMYAKETPSKDKLYGRKRLPAIVQPKKTSPGFLRSLCSELEAWDLQHPKSFAQPTLPPVTPDPSEPSFPSEETSEELLCSTDLTCVPCTASTEYTLGGLDIIVEE